MQRRATEISRIQRLQQTKTHPEILATDEPSDTVQSPNDGNSHLNRIRKGFPYNDVHKGARSGYRSRSGIMETDKLGKEAHRLDDEFKEQPDGGWHSKRLPRTAESSSHARKASRSKMSIKARAVVGEFIMEFVRMLYHNSSQVLWRRGGTTVQRPHQYIQVEPLKDALEVYATQLLSVSTTVVNNSADPNEVIDATLVLVAAVLIQQYKLQIAQLLSQFSSAQYSSKMDSLWISLQQISPPDFSPKRLGLKTTSVVISSVDHVVDLADVLDGPITNSELDTIMSLLDTANEMRLLNEYVQHCLYRHDNSAMQMIKAAMSKENLKGHKAQISVPWRSIQEFMYRQYGDMSRMSSVVTLTGCSTQHAQASTCADYIKMTWPDTGKFFLEFVDVVHSTIEASVGHRAVQISLQNDRGLSIVADIPRAPFVPWFIKFMAEATDVDLLVQLAQQLSWLSSAFTVSPFEEQLAYSSPYFSLREQGVFEIAIRREPIDDPKQACWLSLFGHACLVSGFPISERADEIGLELSLDLLAGLSGARHVFEYEGGLVMKGFSHMFVPVRRQLDRVQWHAVSSPDEETPLSYHDGISRCKSRAMLDEVSLQDLASLRAIIGWCSEATICLGSSHADYENIDYTKADEANSGLRCTGGSLGFQQFGVAALDVRFGPKDGKSHFQRRGPYQRILQFAEGSPIVLHDVGQKQSWLVPATNVMLHIVQHRHRLDPFQANGELVKLDTNIATGSSAKEVMLNNRTQTLFEHDKHTFMDEILDIWSILEFLLAQNLTRQREAPGVRIPSSLHESLYGFEFKAVVQQDAPYKLKRTTVSRNHGGWSKLIEDIDALVLFANGFGDVIRPAGEFNQGLCRKWRRVPHGQDYLATTTNMLQTLFDKAGSRVDRKYLTTKSKLRWHQGSSALFNECQDVTTCDCTRLQQLIPESAIKSAQTPTSIVDEGAVIFGHPEPRSAPVRSTVSKNSSSLYSQTNIPILPRIVRRRSSTNDERKGKIRRLDIEAEGIGCEQDHRPEAMS